MQLTLKVWRQKNNKNKGHFETYKLNEVSEHMSFLEMAFWNVHFLHMIFFLPFPEIGKNSLTSVELDCIQVFRPCECHWSNLNSCFIGFTQINLLSYSGEEWVFFGPQTNAWDVLVIQRTSFDGDDFLSLVNSLIEVLSFLISIELQPAIEVEPNTF